jgi:hypothetical protein
VPPATGKLIICAAKMNAAMMPINGTCFSPSILFVLLMATASTPAVITQHTSATTRLRNPSGICMGTGEYNMVSSFFLFLLTIRAKTEKSQVAGRQLVTRLGLQLLIKLVQHGMVDLSLPPTGTANDVVMIVAGNLINVSSVTYMGGEGQVIAREEFERTVNRGLGHAGHHLPDPLVYLRWCQVFIRIRENLQDHQALRG